MHPVLKNVLSLIHVLKGITATSWLPGFGEKFNFTPRHTEGTRPLFCVTHVTDDGRILFGASISRPANGKLHYRPLIDLHRPAGDIIGGSNGVMIGVCVDHLKALYNWAQRQVRYPEPLPAPVWPTLVAVPVYDGKTFVPMTDLQPEEAAAEIMARKSYEDFTPVLNARYWNPARILVRPDNPAAEILGRHKVLTGGLLAYTEQHIDNAEAVLSSVVREMREAIPLSFRYTDNELLAACDKPGVPLPAKNWDRFVEGQPDAVVAAMKRLLKPAIAAACRDEDLIVAAHNYRDPLTVAFRSEVQVVKASVLDSMLPGFYSGTVLPRDRAASPANIEDDMTPVVSTPSPVLAEVENA